MTDKTDFIFPIHNYANYVPNKDSPSRRFPYCPFRTVHKHSGFFLLCIEVGVQVQVQVQVVVQAEVSPLLLPSSRD